MKTKYQLSKEIVNAANMNYNVTSFMLILSFDIPNVDDQSIIQFFNITFNKS